MTVVRDKESNNTFLFVTIYYFEHEYSRLSSYYATYYDAEFAWWNTYWWSLQTFRKGQAGVDVVSLNCERDAWTMTKHVKIIYKACKVKKFRSPSLFIHFDKNNNNSNHKYFAVDHLCKFNSYLLAKFTWIVS